MQTTQAFGSTRNTIADPRRIHQESAYTELKALIRAKGLLEREPSYYLVQAGVTAGLVLLTIVLLVTAHSLSVRLLTAVLMAVTSAQLGFLGHDLGHRQVFKKPLYDDLVMLVITPLLGILPSWWIDAHNRHHSTPNDLERDPHTTIPVLAFSEGQVRRKTGISRFLIRQQAYYFLPLLCLSIVGTKLNGIVHVARGQAKYPLAEVFGFSLHVVLYSGLLIWTMPLADALLVATVHHALTGLYFGLMFAPNHKGMPTFSSAQRPDFLRSQVLTSRNIRPNPVTDFLYGGLNYQIEHHLFPNMPRNHLKAAQPIVRSFCLERGISYYETSFLRSYSEVFGHLKKVVAV